MKRFALAIALACVLSGSALAGDVPAGQDAPAPGQGITISGGDVNGGVTSAPGDVHTGGEAPGDMSTSDLAAQTLLTILNLVF